MTPASFGNRFRGGNYDTWRAPQRTLVHHPRE